VPVVSIVCVFILFCVAVKSKCVFFILWTAYQNRMHALPPPEVLRTANNPYLSERMRKRRCFADKDLEMVMMERERHCLDMAARSRAPSFNHPQLATAFHSQPALMTVRPDCLPCVLKLLHVLST
jgi:hypothetical protein